MPRRKELMFVGYILSVTQSEALSHQEHALRQAGCEVIILDEGTGARSDQPGLLRAMSLIRPGDTLVVWRLSRLGRSLQDVAQKIEAFGRRGIGVRSLCEAIDTTGQQGQAQRQVFSALVEFEHHLGRERTLSGLRAARARGRQGGRRRTMTSEKVKLASQLWKESSVNEICLRLGVSRSTLYRYVGPKGEIRKP